MSNSTAILTDLAAVVAATPTATSTADAIAAAGPMIDLVGAIALAQTKAKELKTLLTAIKASSDSGDANYYTTVTNIIGTLS